MTQQQRLEIVQICTDLINRFANYNDAQRYQQLADLFAEDGRFARPTDPDNFTEGRANILAAFQARPKDKITRHVISNIQVDVIDENHAKGLCYAVLYTGSSDKPAAKFGLQAAPSQFVGEFHDEFVKTEEGWRIASRSGGIVFTAGE